MNPTRVYSKFTFKTFFFFFLINGCTFDFLKMGSKYIIIYYLYKVSFIRASPTFPTFLYTSIPN